VGYVFWDILKLLEGENQQWFASNKIEFSDVLMFRAIGTQGVNMQVIRVKRGIKKRSIYRRN